MLRSLAASLLICGLPTAGHAGSNAEPRDSAEEEVTHYPKGTLSGGISVLGPGRVTAVRVDEEGLTGPQIQMGRYGRTLRGRVFDSPTEIDWGDDLIRGFLGPTMIDLHVLHEPGQLHIRGLYANELSDLRISPAGIEGHIGACGYSLPADAGRYAGFEGGPGAGVPLPTAVYLPRSLAGWPEGEMTAALVLMLGACNHGLSALQAAHARGYRAWVNGMAPYALVVPHSGGTAHTSAPAPVRANFLGSPVGSASTVRFGGATAAGGKASSSQGMSRSSAAGLGPARSSFSGGGSFSRGGVAGRR
jgi:hypothetical protein